MKTNRTSRLLSAATAALTLAIPVVTSAADVTWDGGGGDDLWGTGANWVGDAAPSLGDNIHFAGTTRLTPDFN